MTKYWLGIIVLSTWLVGIVSSAELDSVSLRLLGQYDSPLRWDNVEGAPIWSGGKPLEFDAERHLHSVTLVPGESTHIQLPPLAMLRVALLSGRIQPDNQVLPPGVQAFVSKSESVEIWNATGHGIYVKQTPSIANDGSSLLVVPNQSNAVAVRITRPLNTDSGECVALFVSRRETVPAPAPYRKVVHVCRDYHVICASDDTVATPCFRLSRRQPREFDVVGPCRVICETRLHYPYGESATQQAFRVGVNVDGKLLKFLEYNVSPEYRRRLTIDGQAANLSRQGVAYFDCPPGRHRVRLSTNATVFARVMQQECPDYLVGLNDRFTPNSPRPSGELDHLRSYWDVTDEQISQCSDLSESAQEQIALITANDNRRRNGGLSAWWMMHRAAANRPEVPELRLVADRFRRQNTFYRNLVPSDVGSSHRSAYFHVRHPGNEDPNDPPDEVVVGRQHLHDAIRQLGDGSFFRAASPNTFGPLVYSLPDDRTDSQIRVSVIDDESVCRRLYLQYDEGPPMQLEIASHTASSRSVPVSEAAVSGLWFQHQKYGHGTLGGPFASRRAPAELLDVSYAEIYLPQHVRTVRIWSETDLPQEAPEVALHLRASKDRQLTESEYLIAWGQLDIDPAIVPAALVDEYHDGDSSCGYAWREIWNHWRPIIRLLESQHREFANGIQKSRPAQMSADSMPVESLVAEARQFQDESEWLPAIETWSKVLAHATSDIRREALLNRATALVESGERFLAERQVRSLLLFDDDAQLRDDAVQWLLRLYQQTDDRDAIERLASVAFLRNPTQDTLGDLADALLQNGRHLEAIAASILVTESSPRNRMTTMRAASRVGWWQTFQYQLEMTPDRQEQEFWRGIKCLHHGAYDAALKHFSQAGDKGDAYREHLDNAFGIHRNLVAANVTSRQAAVTMWQDWYGHHPGPYEWQEDSSIAYQFAASTAGYSINQDKYSQFFRAKGSIAVQCKVAGPGRLKIEARPVYSMGHDAHEPVDDWLLISVDGDERSIPITSNRPSQTLRLIGSDEQLGQQVDHIVSIPPGMHWVELRGESRDMLVRCFVERPEHPISVLPPPSESVEQVVLAGMYGSMQTTQGTIAMLPDSSRGVVEALPVLRQLTSRAADDSTIVSVYSDVDDEQLPEPSHAGEVPTVNSATTQSSQDDVLNPPTIEPEALKWIYSNERSAHSSADSEHGADNSPRRKNSNSNVQRVSHIEYGADSSGDLPTIGPDISVSSDHDSVKPSVEDVVRRMESLARTVELDDENSLASKIAGAALRDFYPTHPSIDELHDRLMRNTEWRLFSQFQQTAGVRIRNVPAWSPETPAARVRTALIPELGENERLLPGNDRLVVTVENAKPAQVMIALSAASVDYLNASPLEVVVAVDDVEHSKMVLQPNQPSTLETVSLQPGEHTISVGAIHGIANEYVRIAVSAEGESDPLLTIRERYYYIATDEQPLTMAVSGPARMRVDELRDGKTRTRFITVGDEQKRIELQPAAGQREGWFRVFELIENTSEERSQVNYSPLAPVAVEPQRLQNLAAINIRPSRDTATEFSSLVLTTSELATPDIAFEDLFPLGGQEDATWSLTPGWYKRRPLEESRSIRAPDEFTEFLFTRRYRTDDASKYQQTQFAFRERESAGSTFGLSHGVDHMLDSDNFGFTFVSLDNSWFVQDTDASDDPNTHTAEWSTNLHARLGRTKSWDEKWTHTQTISAFGRWLSMDSNSYRPGEIDQDIFTPYKSDHRAGFTLSDAVWYRPFLDSRLWLRGFATSNEDFDPSAMEAIGFRTGWDQLVGPVELSVSYRLARFLNDKDRLDSFTQHLMNVGLLVDTWHGPRRRFETGTTIQHNLSEGDTSLYFFLAWYFDNGRDYRDFRPGEIPFLRMRRLQAAGRSNNQLLFVDD